MCLCAAAVLHLSRSRPAFPRHWSGVWCGGPTVRWVSSHPIARLLVTLVWYTFTPRVHLCVRPRQPGSTGRARLVHKHTDRRLPCRSDEWEKCFTGMYHKGFWRTGKADRQGKHTATLGDPHTPGRAPGMSENRKQKISRRQHIRGEGGQSVVSRKEHCASKTTLAHSTVGH